jgi:hypothetical protein
MWNGNLNHKPISAKLTMSTHTQKMSMNTHARGSECGLIAPAKLLST